MHRWSINFDLNVSNNINEYDESISRININQINMIRNKLDLFKIQQETHQDESLIPYYYEKVKEEFDKVERQLVKDHLAGCDITKDLRYRDELNRILSSEAPYEIEHYEFFDKYGEDL